MTKSLSTFQQPGTANENPADVYITMEEPPAQTNPGSKNSGYGGGSSGGYGGGSSGGSSYGGSSGKFASD